MEESSEGGSYLGARGSDVPSVPSIIFLLKYFSFPLNLVCSFRGRNVLKGGGFVTPRPDEVHSTCNCKGAYVHQVPL